MAKNTMTAPEIPVSPQWETRALKPLIDGRVPGVDGSMWLYGSVPMSAILDAKSVDKMMAGGGTLHAVFEELAGIASAGINRAASKSSYREFHLLLLNVPSYFEAPENSNIRGYLNTEFRDRIVQRRELLIGVKLRSKSTADGETGREKLKNAFDSFLYTLMYTGTLLSDYDEDHREIAGIFSRAGITVPSKDSLNWSDSWWSHGRAKSIPTLPHDDHIHYIHEMSAKRDIEANFDVASCRNWPEGDQQIRGEFAISFTAMNNLDIGVTSIEDPVVRWAPTLLDAGARVISVRGLVEPQRVTRAQLKSQKKRIEQDMEAFAEKNRSSPDEQRQRRDELAMLETSYARDEAPATLFDCSVIVGFDSVVEDLRKVTPVALDLNPLTNLQAAAWYETMICSNVRANPLKQDLPCTTIAYAGLSNLSQVGDPPKSPKAALLGFTDRDGQPVYVSANAASLADGYPLMIVPGATGSGKATTLSTRIPTPNGYTTMGEIRPGDQVLSRNGEPCTVMFVSDVNEQPDLYRVTLSDGQELFVDADHQWVVSGFEDRNRARKSSHLAAIDRQGHKQEFLEYVRSVAEAAGNELVTVQSIYAQLSAHPENTMCGVSGVQSVLRFMEVPSSAYGGTYDVPALSFTKSDPVKLFPVREVITAASDQWSSDCTKWAPTSRQRAVVASSVLERDLPERDHLKNVARLLVADGYEGGENSAYYALQRAAAQAGIVSTAGFAEVTQERPAHMRPLARLKGYRARDAYAAIAARLEFQIGEELTLRADERILTTADMLAEGLNTSTEASNFAIRVPEPLQLPERELTVAPYTLGAWLGDGGRHHGCITSMDDEIIQNIQADGFALRSIAETSSRASTYFFSGLRKELKGVVGSEGPKLNKRIPASYLRSSFEQRLALLQGLMDTDGTISASGSCELSLNDHDLIRDALELIRSLGIKAGVTENESAYTKDGVKHVTGSRWRVKFTTTLPVFRLARKLARIPASVRETQKWLYVESIMQVASEPARCIQVDSDDSTYLIEGFVPTHNTVVLQWLAHQWGLAGVPQYIIDPKPKSDFSAAVKASGGDVHSFDGFIETDGPLDPIRYAGPANLQLGVQIASDMLARVRPLSTELMNQMETPLANAIRYGVEQGATATGEALIIAARDNVIPQNIVDQIVGFAQTYPMFRATFGLYPGTSSLSVSDGITLFMAGNSQFEFPAAGATDITLATPGVRTSVNVMRQLVRASVMNLSGRGGVLHIDEEWIYELAAPDELVQLGRLARSQNVLVCLYTQTPKGPLNLGLGGFISRGIIGHIPAEGEDRSQAEAGLKLFGSTSAEILSRVVAPGEESGRLNWHSLKALWKRNDDGTRTLHRPAVFFHADLHGNIAPVEVQIPPSFFELASTNPEDVQRREAKAAGAFV